MNAGSMSRWLDVEVGTDEVNLNTLPSNLSLVDLQNDSDFKLLVGDLGRGEEGPKLRMFQGAKQMSDITLIDLPLGVEYLYTNEALPRPVPIVVVAFNTCIYMYRNMKPFYKYYLPKFEPTTCETEAWKQLLDPLNQTPESVTTIVDNLNNIPHRLLSVQTRSFLSMSIDQQLDYLEHEPSIPENKATEVAYITTLRMNSQDRYAVCALVVGTEDGTVIVLEPQTFTELAQAKLCPVRKTPYQMIATGLYTVDYRLTVATRCAEVTTLRVPKHCTNGMILSTKNSKPLEREKSVCLLKRGCNEGRILFSTEDHIISIEVMTTDNTVMVICADNSLSCYSKKGKKQWTIPLDHRPVAMTLVPVSHLAVTLTAVALASGHLQLYSGKVQVDAIFVRDVASVLKFGQLGKEEHVMIIVTGSGNLTVKILKRTAEFTSHGAAIDSHCNTTVGQQPWLIPKKSKLFLEQAVRERENAIAMHVMFQYELNRLRLSAAKTLLAAHSKADNSVAAGALEALKLAAEVEGLGPIFRVTLILENTSPDKAVVGLAILFHVHTANYKVANPYIKVPLLSCGSKLQFPTKVEEIFDDVNPDILFRPVTGQGTERALVKILLVKEGRSTPVLAATVVMPPTDPMMVPYDKIQGADGWANEMFDKDVE